MMPSVRLFSCVAPVEKSESPKPHVSSDVITHPISAVPSARYICVCFLVSTSNNFCIEYYFLNVCILVDVYLCSGGLKIFI